MCDTRQMRLLLFVLVNFKRLFGSGTGMCFSFLTEYKREGGENKEALVRWWAEH